MIYLSHMQIKIDLFFDPDLRLIHKTENHMYYGEIVAQMNEYDQPAKIDVPIG